MTTEPTSAVSATKSGGPLEVAVLGPGGVGGLVGALLARAGDPVRCLAGADTVSVLRERGLRVASGWFGSFSVGVTAAEGLDHPVDVCLVTVKATQLNRALDRVPAAELGGALLVPLLNGVEHVDELRRRYPAAIVAAGSIRVESTRIAPGEIRHDSPFASMELAAVPPAEAVVQRLAAHLERAGLDVRVRADEPGLLWDKLAFLAPLALLTTAVGAPAGVVREHHREDLVSLLAEVAAVARAEGARADQERLMATFDSVPAIMQSSMQRDAAAGRPIELEAIGGAVLRAANRHGIPVPVTTRLVEQLRPQSDGSS